jgi:YVTN family beta-propeller protein
MRSLAARWRLETGVGAAVLLAAALIGRTLAPVATAPAAPVPAPRVRAPLAGAAAIGAPQVLPGRLGVANTVLVDGVHAAALRLASESLDMRMGRVLYAASSLGNGRWRATNVYPPMNGHWALTVQVVRPGGWVALHRFIYQVPLQGTLHLLASAVRRPGTTAPAVPAFPPSRVRWGRLPYRAIVSFVDNGLLYVPGHPTALYVGQQNHSVTRAPDGTVWVTDYAGNTIAVLDYALHRIVARVPVGLGPAYVAFTPNGHRAYVSNFLSDTVSVVDVPTHRVLRTIRDQFQPDGLAITPDGRQVWVPYSLDGEVGIIDARTSMMVSAIFPGGAPHAVAFSPDGRTAYVTDAAPGARAGLFAIDRTTGLARTRLGIGTGPAMVAVSHDGRRIYVTGRDGSVLTVIDAATMRILSRVPVGSAPQGLALTPDGRLLYVCAGGGNGHVAVVATATDQVVATIAVPGAAGELALVH